MPEKHDGRTVAETKAAEEKHAAGAGKAASQEKKFKVGKLRENCMQLFGVTASTFDGAFYGNKETEMTVKKAGAIISKWLGKER